MYIFFLVIDYSIPLLMIISYPWWKKVAFGKVSRFSGMRTSLSMKNEENWKKANILCGRYSLRMGLALLIFVVLLRHIEIVSMEWNSLIISTVGIILLIGVTIFTNRKLKQDE